jgi:hypothetical protein
LDCGMLCGRESGIRADTARKRLGWPLRRKLRCSFCARDAARVERLVAGASAYICGECVNKCVAVLEQHGGISPTVPNR